jgi:DNA-binding CsgD family transcriptional regulator
LPDSLVGEIEIDNLRAAFTWSRENSEIERALALASSLQPLWLARGRIREGLAWLNAAHTDDTARVAPAVRARALADRAMLDASMGTVDRLEQAEQALAIACEVNDPALLACALTACGAIHAHNLEVARPYFAEAIELAREVGDGWRLRQVVGWQAYGAWEAGDPTAARALSEEGRDLADAIGDRVVSRQWRWLLGCAQMMHGDLVAALAQLREVAEDAEADHDLIWRVCSLTAEGYVLAYQGDADAARAGASSIIEAAGALGGWWEGSGYAALAIAALAAGDVAAAHDATEAVINRRLTVQRETVAILIDPMAQAALARGDVGAARHWADEAVNTTTGWHLMLALTTRTRVAIAEGHHDDAERDAHDALTIAARIHAYLGIPDILECLAGLAGEAGNQRHAARLFGAAEAIRRAMGAVRFKIWDASYDASVAARRDAMGDNDFDRAWAEGAGLTINDAVARARRGRGERKRPASGWASLTPTEHEVARLVGEGLANKHIAARLFVSPRTVQTHLTHAYTKLGLSSRVQLAQEAARHD